MSGRTLDRRVVGLLALLPALACLPAWIEPRLLGPGDGAALHYPLRVAAWDELREGALPGWNHAIFGGAPLLAGYRPGALHPAMLLLAPLPPFAAFQLLVLGSLAASGGLLYLYLRRLGCEPVGAYLGGLGFALGPYLVGHFGDTATLVAAPALPLVLWALEHLLERPTPLRTAALAGAVALLLLAGSFEASAAGAALLVGRLALARHSPGSVGAGLLGLLAGAALAAPQLLPTALAALDAGRQVSGLADPGAPLPGAAGLVLRYVSHTPAGALALAALPLALQRSPVRALVAALSLCLLAQWGRGPLADPGALPLLFDLLLAMLAAFSLSAQWRARREDAGRRLRAYFLFWALVSAAALSISAAALGPLPHTLAGSVGVLALCLILYFSSAAEASPTRARVWLLPLTVSFLLQPYGRQIFQDAPTRLELEHGTPTLAAIDRILGPQRRERILTLTRAWPHASEADLAWANLAMLAGRRSANGYDPMVPLRSRAAYGGLGPDGRASEALFAGDPLRLEMLGLRWVQTPVAALVGPADERGLGEALALAVAPGRARFLPLPIMSATEVRLAAHWSGAPPEASLSDAVVVLARLATGRLMPTALPAASERADTAGGGLIAVFALPGRYHIDGIRVERIPGEGRLTLTGAGLRDAASGRVTGVSRVAAWVSDRARLREAAATPFVRLFEVVTGPGLAHVATGLWTLPSDEAVLGALRSVEDSGIDPWREALAVAAEVEAVSIPPGSEPARAQVARVGGGRLDVRAAGPGLLVAAESWDPGWSVQVDGVPARLLRLNHAQLGVVLGSGLHRVLFEYRVRGFRPGLALAALAAVALAVRVWRERAGRD